MSTSSKLAGSLPWSAFPFFNLYSSRIFGPEKAVLLRSLVALMIVAGVISSIERRRYGSLVGLSERCRHWLKRPVVLFALLLLFAYLISMLFSIAPQTSFSGSYLRLLEGPLSNLRDDFWFYNGLFAHSGAA